jgi:ribonuclease BN (tRNA processing enzyme)
MKFAIATRRSLASSLALVALFMLAPASQAKGHHHHGPDTVAGPLSVMVLGSGGPMAVSNGRASAGYLVFTDGQPRVLMGMGGGTFQRLGQSGVNIHAMDILLLSHLHADHDGELTPMIKTIYFHNLLARTSRTNPIRIWGPDSNGVTFPAPNDTVLQYPSTVDYVNDHYALPDGSDRYLHIFATAISGGASQFAVEPHNLNPTVAGATIENVLTAPDGLQVDAIAVNHGPAPAVAYRISYKGRSVVYSGDTSSMSDNMITIASHADLLIYDTSIMDVAPPNPVFHALHTSPTRLGQVAAAAHPRHLLLSHLTPVTEPNIKTIKDIIRSQGYHGHISAAHDLAIYNLGDDD